MYVCLAVCTMKLNKYFVSCLVYYENVWDYALVFGSFWKVSPVPRAGSLKLTKRKHQNGATFDLKWLGPYKISSS